MKRNKVIYGIFLIASIIFAYLYPGTVSSMFFYTVILIPIVSLVYTFYIYLRFTYLQDVDKKFVTKGDQVNFYVDIANETKVLYPHVEIVFYGVDTIFTKHFKTRKIAIMPDSKGRYHFELECRYRGYYEVGLKQVKIKDFLGFFGFNYKVFEPKYITVYPKVVPLNTFGIHTSRPSYAEGILSEKDDDGITLSDIRKYAYGDSIKKIHWKLSAKKDELMIKNLDSTSITGAAVFLDLTKNTYSVLDNIILEDKVVEAAVAIVNYCLTHNIEVEFIYHDREVKKLKAADYSYFQIVYNTLFKIQFESNVPFKDTIELALEGDVEKNAVILITSNLNEGLYSQISIQHGLGYEVILVYISAEELIPLEQNQKAEHEMIFLALQEMNIRTYKVQINDDIKSILEC